MLTLILQTQEGHQIELNVRPEDTFADLKSQYADHEVLGLSDSLEQLITNGADIPENTKIFDYVTGSAQEWFSTDKVEEPVTSQSIETVTKFRECCARDCSNTEAATPGKTFFPLPTDHDRLSACLIEAGRPDLYDRIFGLCAKEREKYFLCDGHVSQESSCVLPVPAAVEQPPTLSLPKPKNDRPRSNVIEEIILAKDEKEDEEKEEEKEAKVNDNELQEITFDGKDSMLELFDTVENFQHPGILCRLCGKLAENPINLYVVKDENIEDEFSLADKINLCLPVTITITDSLPKQICQDCHVKLDVCHDLAIKSLQTEDKLKILLRENKLCVDVEAENKQCPLCVKGHMKIVQKSGIYRREDTKDCVFSTKTVVSTDENLTNLFSSNKVQLNNYTRESSTIDTVHETCLPMPNDEFLCSICSSIIVNFDAIKTHVCHRKNSITSRSCVICSDTNFTDSQELEAHCDLHGSSNDKTFDQLKRCTSQEFQETMNNVKTHSSNKTEIYCDNYDKIASINEHFLVKSMLDDGATRISVKRQKFRYSCHFCEKPFARKIGLEKHIKSSHKDSSKVLKVPECYKCKACCEAFAGEIEAKNHVKLKHLLCVNDVANTSVGDFFIEKFIVTCLYICEFCEHSFTIPSSLHEHREIEHSKNLRYSCAACNITFVSHRKLATHKNLVSHRRPLDSLDIKQFYVCKYCDKIFIHRTTYTNHVFQHRTTTKPYHCRICNIRFVNYHDISKHRDEKHPYQPLLQETTSVKYNCQYCRKQFVQEVALFKHIRMHTGERPYKCTICDKGFSQSSGLYTHLKIHSDLRPFNCTKCSRTFKFKSDRDNHEIKHTGKRPYKCELCDKAFMTQHVYSQHCKIHTDERPYKCDICDKSFRRSHVLTVHMRGHTGEKPYVCEMCPKAYRQRGDLLKHQKLQHDISNIANNCENDDFDNFDNFDGTNEYLNIRESFDSLLLPL